MAEVGRLLRASEVELGVADPASPEARACIDAYVQELQDRFEGGFDPARSVSAEPGELVPPAGLFVLARLEDRARSEEHTSELQSLMRIPYAVFCLKKKNI